MLRIRTTLVAILLLAVQLSIGQYISDASALWARTGITGTARTVGSAGAYGSVGADLGSITINPAGLGLYRSTDFSITPLLQFGNNEAVYNGNHTIDHKTSFFLAQGGFAITKLFKNTNNQMGFEQQRTLRSFTFALNFQQTDNFNRNQRYNSTNTTQSLIDGYASLLNYYNQPIGYFPVEMQVAAYANLLSQGANGQYTSNIKAPVQQLGGVSTRGGVNRIDAAFGFNFIDKLYFGFDLAVPIINYNVNSDINETPATGAITDYTFDAATSESGYGFNGILGLIYRPAPWVRIGAAYHLPTWYAMHENYTLNFSEDSGSYTLSGPATVPSLKYGIRMPMKGDFSASFYYKQYGFISVDYDMENLGATKVHIPNDSFQQASSYNSLIKSTYKLTHTVHVGIEGAIKIVRLRAGYSFSSSPFKKDQLVAAGYTDQRNAITAGIGIRLKHFYIDAAYVYGWTKDASVELTNYNFPLTNTYGSSTVLLTLGWKFEAGGKNNTTQRAQPQRQYTPPPVDSDQRF